MRLAMRLMIGTPRDTGPFTVESSTRRRPPALSKAWAE